MKNKEKEERENLIKRLKRQVVSSGKVKTVACPECGERMRLSMGIWKCSKCKCEYKNF